MERLTQGHIYAAMAAGACKAATDSLRAGMPIGSLPFDYLIWADENLPRLSESKLWINARSGCGDGCGYGYGYGEGEGGGYGDGCGVPYPDPSGSGYGSYGYGPGMGEEKDFGR